MRTILFFICFIASFTQLMMAQTPQSQPQQQDSTIENETVDVESDFECVLVEVQPEFPGGMDGLMKYLAKNMRYPAKAKANNVQGRVVLKFIVDKQGCISDVEVVKSLDPECDAEAIRLIKNMPKWNPGKIDGEPVDRCSFTCPVIFNLSP